MRRLVAPTLVAGSLVLSALVSTGSAAAPEPTHQVVVASLGGTIKTWPAYTAGVDRFAIRPNQAASGVSVTATSSEAAATVRVNGRPVANGAKLNLPDAVAGDEVNVQITDSAGTSNQSWIVLPAGFPELTASGPSSELGEGHWLMGLQSFFGSPYTAVVDANAVPVHAVAENAADLKQSDADPEHYSVARPQGGGWRIDELDERFEQVASHQLVGYPASSTDFHDSELLPGGGALLMGYDPATRDGHDYTDAVIEVQDDAGEVTFSWNSKDHVDPEAEGLVDRSAHDYAHVNSLQMLANGDVLASFRNLSQVMLIAGSDHDGHEEGDVIWRLGGIRNDFDIADETGTYGPCAQHSARMLSDGHLLIFDNGSRRDEGEGPVVPQTAAMCADPADPDGDRVERPQTRVTEYALDTSVSPPTATLVWSYEQPDVFASFAGNVQRLADGHTVIGWSNPEHPAGTVRPVASEVDADGNEVWTMTANGYFTYRVFKYDVPDRIAPEVEITSPADGAVVTQGSDLTAAFTCGDTGGSNLDECAGSVPHGSSLTSEVGPHALTVTATDREGNETARTVHWTVTAATPTPTPTPTPTATPTPTPTPSDPAPVADVLIRKPGGGWIGRGPGTVKEQTLTLRRRAGSTTRTKVRIRNVGDRAGRLRVDGSTGNRWVSARWYDGSRDVTRRVRAGRYRTERLEPGSSVVLRLVLTIREDASGRRAAPRLGAKAGDSAADVVRARVRVR